MAFLAHISLFSQITGGMNYFHLGGMSFNQDIKILEDYPPFLDTTSTDSSYFRGSNDVNLMLGYYIGCSKHISIGFTSRFLTSKESSFAINSGGLSLRYHFGIRTSKNKNANQESESGEALFFSKTNEPARSVFYIDATGLFGNMKFQDQKVKYQNGILQFGAMLRFPVDNKKFLRHLGIQVSAGVSYRSTVSETYKIFPVATGGINFHLDKKYTTVRRTL